MDNTIKVGLIIRGKDILLIRCRMSENLPLQRLERGQEVTQGTTSTSQKKYLKDTKREEGPGLGQANFILENKKEVKKTSIKKKREKPPFIIIRFC